MNNLPTTLNLPETLPAYAVEWVGAKFNELPFNKLGQDAQKKGCLEIITIAHSDDGNKGGTDTNVLVFQTQALIGELSGKFGTLTLSEIKRAFKMGIRGEFGEYFGLCPKTYHQFLKGYSTHPERLRAQTEYLQLVEKASVPTSNKPLAQIQKESKESCMRIFKEYKKEGTLPPTNAYYNLLRFEYKVINWTKEEMAEIRKEAEKAYTEKLKVSRSRGEIKQSEYENIVANLDESNKTFLGAVKKIALKRYFDKIDKLEL